MNFTRKNIILDLDATLIDTQSLVGARSALVLGKGVPTHTCGSDLGHLCIFKRPGVDAFIEWCFKNFENVGIWTLSSSEWLEEVLTHVFHQVPRHKWSLLWTENRATRLRGTSKDAIQMGGVGVLKDLNKIFKNKTMKRKGFTRWNTLIVEDTPSNCIRNYGNAVYIPPFDILDTKRDEALHYLKLYLERKILPSTNVRCLEKRNWIHEVMAEEKARKSQVKHSDSIAFWMSENWKTNLVDIATRSLNL